MRGTLDTLYAACIQAPKGAALAREDAAPLDLCKNTTQNAFSMNPTPWAG